MKHKSTVLFIVLLLLVFCITSSGADSLETVTTITVQTGSLLSEYEEVSQILDLAAIRIHSMADGYGAFVLSLNNTDALTSLFKSEQDGLYVQSNVIGQQSLYFTWEDIKTFVIEQMEAAASEMENTDMPFDMSIMQSFLDGTVTEAQINEMMGLDEELFAYFSDIQDKQIVETGSFVLNGSDTADTKTVITLTPEDLSRAVDLPIVHQMMSQQMTMNETEYSEADATVYIDEELAEVKQWIESSKATVSVTAYTQNEELVAMNTAFTAVIDEDDALLPVSVSTIITKTSIETAAFYQMSVDFAEGDTVFTNQYGSLYVSNEFVSGQYTLYEFTDEPLLQAVVYCDRSDDNQTIGEIAFSLLDGDEQTVYIQFNQTKAANVTNTGIDVFFGSGVDAIKSALAETSLLSLNINTVIQEDSGFFADLQSATPDNSVQLLKLTEENLALYTESMQQSMLMTVLTVIDNLPPEISNSLLQGLGGY